MVSSSASLIANLIIQLPFMIIMGAFAISVSGFGGGLFNGDNYIQLVLIWSLCAWVYESAAQLFSITSKQPLIGMRVTWKHHLHSLR